MVNGCVNVALYGAKSEACMLHGTIHIHQNCRLADPFGPSLAIIVDVSVTSRLKSIMMGKLEFKKLLCRCRLDVLITINDFYSMRV